MTTPSEQNPPFALLGGADAVRALVERFYDLMTETEPALAAIHPCDPPGVVNRGSRDRFALFLIGWLGGPQDYIEQHGHPRLRMRHGRVAVNIGMRDAWLRCMAQALTERGVTGELRAWLDKRFIDVADFMRNTEG